MEDLINRQAAIEAVMFGSLGSSTVYGRSEQGMAAQKDTLLAIRMLPSVDAVEVVRCKDCKHSYETFAGLICSHGVCVDCVVRDDFYCSFGERKDG